MPELKIVYWNMVARAFPTQAMLLASDTAYEWDQDTANRGAYKEIAPFGQVPLLIVDGTVLAQSMATQRAAARIAFPPSNDVEWSVIDMLMEQSTEIFGGITKCFGVADDAARASAWAAYENEGVAKVVAPLAARIKENGGTLLAGKMSAADVCLFSNLHLLVRSGANTEPLFAAFPEVKAHYDTVMAMGGLKAHCDLNLSAYYVKK